MITPRPISYVCLLWRHKSSDLERNNVSDILFFPTPLKLLARDNFATCDVKKYKNDSSKDIWEKEILGLFSNSI